MELFELNPFVRYANLHEYFLKNRENSMQTPLQRGASCINPSKQCSNKTEKTKKVFWVDTDSS